MFVSKATRHGFNAKALNAPLFTSSKLPATIRTSLYSRGNTLLHAQPYQVGFKLTPPDNHRLANLCGQLDEHLRLIEQHLAVQINVRGNHFQIIGAPIAAQAANAVIHELYKETDSGTHITQERVHLLLREAESQVAAKTHVHPDNIVTVQTPKLLIKPRTTNQQRYVANMSEFDINFGIGPAGTGKTFLAVARAIDALEQGRVNRIILVRPAVEAGENLGFLPGDLAQKIDPYLRPLYDALYEMLGFENVGKLIQRGVIELAPLAYMRGRTLNDAFIILDEAQNTTPEQMKMFLTRMGFNSIAVITGDITQVDLPKNKLSGLRQAIEVLQKVSDISFTFFQTQDVIRHALVQKIVQAYADYEQPTL
jgi:phosphate starvation-inducible PhoH-like protein